MATNINFNEVKLINPTDGSEVAFNELDAASRKEVMKVLRGQDRMLRKTESTFTKNPTTGGFVGSGAFWTIVVAGSVVGTVLLTVGTIAAIRALTADRTMNAGGCADCDGIASAAAYRAELGI